MQLFKKTTEGKKDQKVNIGQPDSEVFSIYSWNAYSIYEKQFYSLLHFRRAFDKILISDLSKIEVI